MRGRMVSVWLGVCGCSATSASLPTSELFSTGGTDSPDPDPSTDSGSGSGSGGSADTAPPSDSGGTTTLEYAWEDPAWWTEPGPLQGLFDLDLSVASHWRFWYTTSPDLETWADPIVLGHNFSSLDLLQLDEGLILSGSLIPNVEAGIHGPFSAMFSLVTTDLETWGSHYIEVEGADELPMIIDPSLHKDQDGGYRMLFFGAGHDVDPEAMPDDYPNPHAIRTGFIQYDRIVVEDLTPIVEGDYVVDPSGCWWHGVHHILGTNRYDDLFHQYRRAGADSFWDADPWGGVQVPFCFIDEQNDRMGLIAQHGGGHGPPRVRWCNASQECEEQQVLLPEDKLWNGQCTTPVMAWYQEQYILFCASWYNG